MYKKIILTSIGLMFCMGIFPKLILPYCNFANEDIPEIQWISLSYNDYDDEKEAIRAYFKKDFEIIKKVINRNVEDVPIAIGCYDLNHDGIDEIITFISDTEFHGAKDSGCLIVLEFDGKVITGARSIAGFPLDISTLNNSDSKQIGILVNEEGWNKLYVNKHTWETEIKKETQRGRFLCVDKDVKI